MIRKAWSCAEWFGPTMSILDPIKDVNGSRLRVQYGLSTMEREAAEMTGSDYEENLMQIAYETKLSESLGIKQADAPKSERSMSTQEGTPISE